MLKVYIDSSLPTSFLSPTYTRCCFHPSRKHDLNFTNHEILDGSLLQYPELAIIETVGFRGQIGLAAIEAIQQILSIFPI